jgi:hypothetical protein
MPPDAALSENAGKPPNTGRGRVSFSSPNGFAISPVTKSTSDVTPF